MINLNLKSVTGEIILSCLDENCAFVLLNRLLKSESNLENKMKCEIQRKLLTRFIINLQINFKKKPNRYIIPTKQEHVTSLCCRMKNVSHDKKYSNSSYQLKNLC